VDLGLPDQARAMVARAQARAARVREPLARVVAYWCTCLVGARLGSVDAVELGAGHFERLVAETQVHQGKAPALWFRGLAEIRSGRTAAGIPLVREGYESYKASGTLAGATETLSYLAEGFIADRRWDDAQATLDEADVLVTRFKERHFVSDLLVLKARVESGRGNLQGADAALQEALAQAQARGALGTELRVAVALAERRNRAPGDLDVLRAAYARITEGFDVSACVRARELLAAAP
jgi:hypothetical protein